jgi:hypothetical protein
MVRPVESGFHCLVCLQRLSSNFLLRFPLSCQPSCGITFSVLFSFLSSLWTIYTVLPAMDLGVVQPTAGAILLCSLPAPPKNAVRNLISYVCALNETSSFSNPKGAGNVCVSPSKPVLEISGACSFSLFLELGWEGLFGKGRCWYTCYFLY